MAYIPSSGSVVAFQSLPSSLLTGASIIGLTPVAVTNTPSISGTVNVGNFSGSVVAFQGGPMSASVLSSIPSSMLTGASIFGQLPAGTAVLGSVAALQGTNPWQVAIISGSVATTTTNSSVMLLNGANVIGSVTALQGTLPWAVAGSIAGTYTEPNVATSVTGLAVMFKTNVSTSTMGVVSTTNPLPVNLTTSINQSVSGTVGASLIGSLPAGAQVIGSVAVLQGTNPWITTFGNSSIFATQQGTHIASVVSSIPSSMLTGASIFGMIPAGSQVIGSIAVLQGTNPWIETFSNSSILSTQQGTHIASVVSSTPSSLLAGASIFGQLPAGTATLGSVVAYQGVTPWVTVGSVYGNVAGSVLSFSAGTWKPSVINLITRNDTTSSFLGADLVERPMMGDALGRTVIKPFVSEDATIISYTGSVVSASVTLIQASALGKKSYITDWWITNTGSVAQLVTFQDGSTSVLGYTIAPAGGGSNSPGINIPLKTANAQDLAFKVTGTSSVVYMTVKGYQAQ